MKRVVLDTNVLLVCISERSKVHWIFEQLIANKFYLCVTTEILNEYAEIIERYMGAKTSDEVLQAIINRKTLIRINTFFNFRLLRDEDDDKFVDCAIAANAHFIVSHDKDFNILKNIDFPKVHVIDTEEFKRELGY